MFNCFVLMTKKHIIKESKVGYFCNVPNCLHESHSWIGNKPVTSIYMSSLIFAGRYNYSINPVPTWCKLLKSFSRDVSFEVMHPSIIQHGLFYLELSLSL
jgi:hypothetical protein